MNDNKIVASDGMIKTLEKTKIYIMSEFDDRAFAEYTTSTVCPTSFMP